MDTFKVWQEMNKKILKLRSRVKYLETQNEFLLSGLQTKKAAKAPKPSKVLATPFEMAFSENFERKQNVSISASGGVYIRFMCNLKGEKKPFRFQSAILDSKNIDFLNHVRDCIDVTKNLYKNAEMSAEDFKNYWENMKDKIKDVANKEKKERKKAAGPRPVKKLRLRKTYE
jgi:hypothetical protein